MELKIFFGLSIIYFFLGIISILKTKYKDIALKLFFVLTILLPIGKLTTKFHTNLQVSSYFFFFLGSMILFIIHFLRNLKLNKKVLTTIIVTSFFVVFLAIHYFIFSDRETRIIDILKDIKPYFIFIMALVFMQIYKKRLSSILTRRFCNKLLTLNLILTSVLFFFMLQFDLHLALTDDPYFKYEEVRLETLGIFFGGFYLLYLFIKNEKPTLKEIIVSFVPLLYTGNRTIIFAFLLVFILIYLSKLTVKKTILIVITSTISFFSIAYLVINATENSPFYRIQKLFERGYLSDALNTRFSPFINSIADFSSIDFITGKGLGHTFYIKWFVWRSEIDNYNIYLDNLYLTLYTKYGVFSTLFFLIFYLYLISFRNYRTSNYYFLLFLLIAITNSFCYQFNFLWVLILIAIPFNTNKNLKYS